MRSLEKSAVPPRLQQKAAHWVAKVEEVGSTYYKTRYRETTIKEALRAETHDKCAYCESKIGHNTPGDVEHKIPTSLDETGRFNWDNLTIACTECNRRKNDYYDVQKPFIDPYCDNVEELLLHLGPAVFAVPGRETAEISVRVLELGDIEKRFRLFAQKTVVLKSVLSRMERILLIDNEHLRELLIDELLLMGERQSEFSAMVQALLSSSPGPWTANA